MVAMEMQFSEEDNYELEENFLKKILIEYHFLVVVCLS